MADYMPEVFKSLMTDCGTLESWNRFILPLMKVETPELRHLAAEEAKRRGYKSNRRKVATSMTKKKIWQYKCDFCGKRNLSGGHMKAHEKHCTMNHNRACRFHKFCEDTVQPKLSELITTLRLRGLEAAREVASDCPCCLLAALRQSGMGTGSYDEEGYVEPAITYDFKSEMAAKWKDINEAKL